MPSSVPTLAYFPPFGLGFSVRLQSGEADAAALERAADWLTKRRANVVPDPDGSGSFSFRRQPWSGRTWLGSIHSARVEVYRKPEGTFIVSSGSLEPVVVYPLAIFLTALLGIPWQPALLVYGFAVLVNGSVVYNRLREVARIAGAAG